MGFFYTNITLKGPAQEQVVSHLRAQRRAAYVSPTINGITVVYDRECEGQHEAVLDTVTAGLSRALQCPALWALLHDDDVFVYALYNRGNRIDAYNSEPGYFGYDAEVPPLPSGGDARALCAAFGVDAAVAPVDALLRRWWVGHDVANKDEGILAEDRHRAVAQALGWPPYTYSMGYHSIGFGNVPEGVDTARLIKIEG